MRKINSASKNKIYNLEVAAPFFVQVVPILEELQNPEICK